MIAASAVPSAVNHAAAPDAASQLAAFAFALLLVDPENIIAEANPVAEDLLGRSARRLVGLPFAEALQAEEPRVQASLLSSDGPLVARDVPVTAGHRRLRVNLTISPLPTHPGWRAITMSEAGKGTEGQSRALELRTPAILAHEIKNPLAAIRGASQLLARRLEAGDRPLAAIITGEVDRIAALIDRMQQLGAAAPAVYASCNLHEAIRAAMAGVRAARGDAVELVEQFDPSLPHVAADPVALGQVVTNLLVNACDACVRRDQPRVAVRTRFVGGQAYTLVRLGKPVRLPVEILVSDNGPGVDPALRDHLFEPFVTTKPSGQGLGLALVSKLLRDMGGRVEHARDEAAGLTHFRINLALAERDGS